MGPRFESVKVHQRPVGQVVKTAASHAVNIGSNPVRVTKLLGGIPERKGIDNEEKGCYNLAVGSGNAFNISDGSNPSKRVGNDCDEGPPVPIPNTEVKLICADNTLRVTARKDRYCQHKYEEQQHKLLLFLFVQRKPPAEPVVPKSFSYAQNKISERSEEQLLKP